MTIQKAQSALRGAFVCGIISTFLTLCVAAIGMFRGGITLAGINANPLLLIDVGLLFGLTVGLYFKSRVCACSMLGYFLLSKYSQFSRDMNPVTVVTGVVFLYFYSMGAWGSIIIHRFKAKEANQALEPTIFADTSRAPSSTSRASEDRGSS